MRLFIRLLVGMVVVLFSNAAFAESEFQFLWQDSFFGNEKAIQGVLISHGSEGTKKERNLMTEELRNSMYSSGRFELVKDGQSMGKIKEKSDEEILDLPFDANIRFICILRSFDAPGEARFELLCKNRATKNRLSFHGLREDPRSFIATKKMTKGNDTEKLFIHVESSVKKWGLPEAVAVVETAKTKTVQRSDPTRLFLAPTRKNPRRIVIGLERTKVSHEDFYALIGDLDLRDQYISQGKTRTTLFIVGSVAMALGSVLLFSGLVQNERCGNDRECKSLLLPILGGTSLGLGGFSIATGFFLDRYPTRLHEDEKLIEMYNREERSSEGLED